MTPPSFTSGELADRFGLELRGDASLDIEGVATLARAEPGQLAFLANSRYRSQLGDSRASLVVMRAEDADAAPGAVLIAKDPYTAFAKMAALFERRQAREPGIHPNAVIDPTARIAPGVSSCATNVYDVKDMISKNTNVVNRSADRKTPTVAPCVSRKKK